MKNLFLSTAMFATILTGCTVDVGSESGDGNVDDGSMTSLNIRLSGASSLTRAMEGKGLITEGTNKLSNVHVFILDAAGTGVTDYAPVTATSDLEAIKSAGWLFPDPIPVDSKVYILGNVHSDYNRTVRELATLDAIRDFTSDIWTQTDYDLASMATVGDPVELSITSLGSASVSVELAPVISRLELHSLVAGGDVSGFTVTGIFLTNYQTAFTYGGGYPAGSLPIDNTIDLATNDGMTGDAANVIAHGSPLTAEMTGNRIWAYNVVAGSLPLLVVRMKNVTVGSKVHPGPLFLTVSSYGGTTEFRAGKIYRIPKLEFTEEHLTLAPSTDGIAADPVEWDWEEITDPTLTIPGTRIYIVPPGGFSGTFPATGAVPQIFNVNAGSKILHTWSAEIDNIAEFEIVVNEPARSFTVSPLGDNPTTSPRTATITVTATIDSGTTRAEHEIKGTYTVTQEAGKPLSPDTPLPTIPMGDPDSKGNILIFHGEGDNAALGLGTWSNNDTDSATPGKITAANYLTTIAYFKWGGVIGFNNADGYTTFNSTVGNEPTNAVMFNPSNVSINAYTDIPSYKTIPATGTVADAAYTSGANVLLGKGDPCRLVGLTVAQIKAAATDPSQWNAMMDASDWRMPIDAENLTFSGNHPIGDGSWYNISSVTSGGSWTQAAPGVAICVQSGNAVLPATGLRSPDLGESKSRGEQGGYWCSTPLENTGTAVIFNSSKFWRINLPNQSCGYALRCVPQD